MSLRLRSYPSFAWRSFWGARSLLEDGSGWRVGNGTWVNIWNDVWLPKPENGRITVQSINTQYTIVADLIDKKEFKWNERVVRELLLLEQADSILRIPLLNLL